MSYEEYLKLISEKVKEAMKHPFVELLEPKQQDIFRIAFLNGCHAMQDHYGPIVSGLESQIQEDCVEQENGEST